MNAPALEVVTPPKPARLDVERLSAMASRIRDAVAHVGGLYMQMCDFVREKQLTDSEVRQALENRFPAPRISEILKVCRAPEEIYKKYRTGFFGFKTALLECRGYKITPCAELNRRRMHRAAERLLKLAGDQETEIQVCGRKVVVYGT